MEFLRHFSWQTQVGCLCSKRNGKNGIFETSRDRRWCGVCERKKREKKLSERVLVTPRRTTCFSFGRILFLHCLTPHKRRDRILVSNLHKITAKQKTSESPDYKESMICFEQQAATRPGCSSNNVNHAQTSPF